MVSKVRELYAHRKQERTWRKLDRLMSDMASPKDHIRYLRIREYINRQES